MATRRRAYLALVEAANGTLLLGQSLRVVLQVQSGFAASLAPLLHLRKPVDVYELAFRMADQLKPLLDAQAAVLTCGPPHLVTASQEVANAAAEYLQAATKMTAAQQRLRGLLPWRPSREHEAHLEACLTRTGEAVRVFVAGVRKDLGEQALPPGTGATRG